MVSAVPVLRGLESVDDHQRVVLGGITWDAYQALLAARGERAVPRMTYRDGELELMAPGWDHETDKKKLARLLEAWSEERGLVFEGYGSWTLKRKAKQAGL